MPKAEDRFRCALDDNKREMEKFQCDKKYSGIAGRNCRQRQWNATAAASSTTMLPSTPSTDPLEPDIAPFIARKESSHFAIRIALENLAPGRPDLGVNRTSPAPP